MEVTVSQGDLVRELGLSQGVVEKKTTIPILSNVLLEAKGERLYFTATDLELGIRCSCPARVVREGAGTIPARRLLDYVRLLPGADVNLKFQENQWASLTCGRSKTRMAGLSRESFPELPEMPEAVAELPVGVVTSMIEKTAFAISNEESRFTLNGALLVLKPDGLLMVATDGHRLAYLEACERTEPVLREFRALVPKKAMTELVKLSQEAGPDAKIAVAGNENHLFFRLGERLLITRRLTGSFPDFERVLPKENPHEVVLQTAEIKAAVERVAQFADERSRAIRVQFKPGEVTISSSSPETGESEESVPTDYSGPEIDIGFNAQYLLDFFRAISDERMAFGLKDQKSAGELRPGANGTNYNYRYVVMPMRI
ncbi:MAG: DNA polymerase III subunit beta [Bryobacteraceae bacterium]